MKTERPLRPEPADTPEARSAKEHADNASNVTRLRTREPARPDALGKADPSLDPRWAWPRTLRFAILVSGVFWLIVGLCVWAYLNAG